ncbi:hypothetical protein EXA18_00650 [Vibrio cincinnatiensis]|uniref:phage baseplate protein n=1 Tax=Vibrio cincinnatiensis TaxID=675 RepID=UPI001EE0BC7C|nr:hypothetical protein [Vibrio cincinnatiensis]MCG3741992.1 hypothetical protein [Vibrio cincinnatiensis]
MANPIYITPQSNYSNGGRFSSLYFDAVHSFVPTFSSRMTKYTISDKSQITNHIVKENVTITMSATITATPINKYENNLVGYTDFKSRPSDAYDLIYSWWNNSVDLFIDEGDRQFTNMQITNIVPIEEGYDARKFDITFEKARRVKYDVVTITGLLANPAEDKAKDSAGNVSTTGKTSTERTSQLEEALKDTEKAYAELLGWK